MLEAFRENPCSLLFLDPCRLEHGGWGPKLGGGGPKLVVLQKGIPGGYNQGIEGLGRFRVRLKHRGSSC